MRLVLQLSTYNSARFLPSLFASLAEQTDRDWTLLVRDDGSDRPEEVATALQVWTGRFSWSFCAGENLGFAGSQQMLYSLHDAELVCLVNHDTILTPMYIEKVRALISAHSDVGAAEGVLLRAQVTEDGVVTRTNIVDSLGFSRSRWHEIRDIGSGKPYRVPVPELRHCFGVSGCLPMYRRSALGKTLFDPAYWMYKEDVDVAYRLSASGFLSVVTGYAIGYHVRGTQRAIVRRTVSSRLQAYSYRNHLWNLRRHLAPRDWWRDGWFVLPYELAKAVYLLVRYPRVLVAVWMKKSLHAL